MQPSRFYELIDDARGSTDPAAPSADPDSLREVLEGLPDDELVAFAAAFDAELVRLNRWELWGAGFVLAGGMGDDSFHYFRAWLVGKGRDAVDRALDDPDSLVEILADADVEAGYDNEPLEYVAGDVIDDRGIEPSEEELHADDDPEGEPFDEDAVDERYPRSAAFAAEHQG